MARRGKFEDIFFPFLSEGGVIPSVAALWGAMFFPPTVVLLIGWFVYRAWTSDERLERLEKEDSADRELAASIESKKRRAELEAFKLAAQGGDPHSRYWYALQLSSFIGDVGMTDEDRDLFVMSEMRALDSDGYAKAGVWIGDEISKNSDRNSPSLMDALAIYRRVLTSSSINHTIEVDVRRKIKAIEANLLEHQDDAHERAYVGVDSEVNWRGIKLILGKCESPPERKLLIGLIKKFGLAPNGAKLEGEISVEPQFVIGKYRADFVVNSKVVVEVDGWEFHQHKIEQDKIRDQQMMLDGYLVLRFPANQVNNNLDEVLKTIAGAVDRYA